MPIKRKKSVKKYKKILDVINFIVVSSFILLAIYMIYNKTSFEVKTLTSVQEYGFLALFVINFFLEFIPQLITPIFTYLPALLLGMNPYWSILTIILGSFCGSFAGYSLGRKFGFDIIEDFFGEKKCKGVVSFMDKYGRFAVFFAAITPFPYVPMIVGSLKLSRRNFIFFGMIPRALALIVFGYLFFIGILSF